MIIVRAIITQGANHAYAFLADHPPRVGRNLASDGKSQVWIYFGEDELRVAAGLQEVTAAALVRALGHWLTVRVREGDRLAVGADAVVFDVDQRLLDV